MSKEDHPFVKTLIEAGLYDLNRKGKPLDDGHWLAEVMEGAGIYQRGQKGTSRPVEVVDSIAPGDPRSSAYAQAALAGCVTELAQTAEGGRNAALNVQAFRLGRFVAGGYLSEFEVRRQLEDAARTTGLGEREIERTLRSGLEAGKREPITVSLPDADPLFGQSPKPTTPTPETVVPTAFYPSDEEYRPIWETNPEFEPVDDEATTPAPESPAAADTPNILPNYDLELYKRHPVLQTIRDHAHSRVMPADSVLLAALTCVSATIPGGITIDTGIGTPASPGLYAALCSRSGGGKTTSFGVARKLTKGPAPLTLSTGEGMLEAFYGETEVTDLDPSGNEVTRRVRGRDKANMLFTVGEGHNLYADMNRDGSKLGGILRDFWSCADIGTTNATHERNRNLEAGTYNGGLVIGLQTSIVGELIGDTSTGTAQRFLWASVNDPTIDPAAPAFDGDLYLPPDIPLTVDGKPIIDDYRITVADDIHQELVARHLAVGRGELVVDEHDTHRPVMLLKIAAVLAWMSGRMHIGLEDWDTAKALLTESDRVRDALLEAADATRVEQTIRKGHQKAAVDAAARDMGTAVNKVSRRVVEILTRAPGPLTRNEIKRGITNRRGQRELLGDAIERLMNADPPYLVCHEHGTTTRYGLSLAGRRAWDQQAA